MSPVNITVLNGSPKGELSVTMQSVAYLAKHYPEHTFDVLHIAQRAKRLENNREEFDQVIDKVRAADAVIWGFPLYILLVHGNYKRFIELVFERDVQDAFAGKYTAAMSTSIHYFDHTAHNYIHGICDDLGMRFVDSFAPDMHDLLGEEGRAQLIGFGRQFLDAVQTQAPTQRRFPPLSRREFAYQPGLPSHPVSSGGKKVVILHDEPSSDSNLAKMVARCRAAVDGDVTVVNIRDLDIKAGCQGCLECAAKYRCFYTGKDAFIDFYGSIVMTSDVLVYAGTMVDRYLSARWKTFFDRTFFNTHTPVLVGKQVALVVSGPLGQTPNLMEIFDGYFQYQGASVVGVVSDETGDSAELDRLLDGLMKRALASAQAGYVHPQTFLGAAGMKVFRDDMYGRLRVIFAADHNAYRRSGLYKTFPQRQLGTRMLNTFGAPIINLPPIRKKFDPMIKPQMVSSHKKAVAKY